MKINITYEVVTEESAEQGEASERGFLVEQQDCGFRELLDTIKYSGFNQPDSSCGIPRWLSDYPEQNYTDGSWTTKTIHPARDKQSQRYWEKAMRYLGYSE